MCTWIPNWILGVFGVKNAQDKIKLERNEKLINIAQTSNNPIVDVKILLNGITSKEEQNDILGLVYERIGVKPQINDETFERLKDLAQKYRSTRDEEIKKLIRKCIEKFPQNDENGAKEVNPTERKTGVSLRLIKFIETLEDDTDLNTIKRMFGYCLPVRWSTLRGEKDAVIKDCYSDYPMKVVGILSYPEVDKKSLDFTSQGTNKIFNYSARWDIPIKKFLINNQFRYPELFQHTDQKHIISKNVLEIDGHLVWSDAWHERRWLNLEKLSPEMKESLDENPDCKYFAQTVLREMNDEKSIANKNIEYYDPEIKIFTEKTIEEYRRLFLYNGSQAWLLMHNNIIDWNIGICNSPPAKEKFLKSQNSDCVGCYEFQLPLYATLTEIGIELYDLLKDQVKINESFMNEAVRYISKINDNIELKFKKIQ